MVPEKAHVSERIEPEKHSIELPAYSNSDVVLKEGSYTLCFSEQALQASWVAYVFTENETRGEVKRTNNFRQHPTLALRHATDDDYSHSGYDRGHLAPAADMAWSQHAMEASFYFTNIAPQKPGFNRGVWKRLESQVRDWAAKNDSICVVTGPVLNTFIDTIGENNIPVPSHYYKAILDPFLPDQKGIAFVLENTASKAPIASFAIPIDSLEKLTGIDFFPALPDSLEQELESDLDLSSWKWD